MNIKIISETLAALEAKITDEMNLGLEASKAIEEHITKTKDHLEDSLKTATAALGAALHEVTTAMGTLSISIANELSVRKTAISAMLDGNGNPDKDKAP